MIIFLVLTFLWGFYIVKKQINFTNTCEIKCYNLGYDLAETKFKSFPWKFLNGECYCSDLILSAKVYNHQEPEKITGGWQVLPTLKGRVS
jgi:hypothetical protein